MASRWTQAATILPPTITVCGRRLLPFCLRHRVALEAINSPVIKTQLELGADDVLAAARILSSHDLTALRQPTTFMEGWKMSRMRFSKRILTEEAIKLHYYFEAQSLWPRFWQKDTSEKDTGIPWPLVVVAALVRNGCSYEEAWTMPEAEAIWLHMAHSQAAGNEVGIVSDTEWEAMEKYKSDMAEKSKTQNTRN
jgi:hypothetical protein